jgi:hypothetical protein
MGGLLGKGGFAICHEAVLAGTRQKYALKIVKSVMPQKKMEQKVHNATRSCNYLELTCVNSSKQSCKFIPR